MNAGDAIVQDYLNRSKAVGTVLKEEAMKKRIAAYLMLVTGAVLMALFGYVSYGFMTSHPLFRWTIFVEPLIFSSVLFFTGVVLVLAGLVFMRKTAVVRE
jgi:hypothetical protein